MYKTGHTFTYLLFREIVANDVINVSLFAVVNRRLLACLDAEGGHFEHYL